MRKNHILFSAALAALASISAQAAQVYKATTPRYIDGETPFLPDNITPNPNYQGEYVYDAGAGRILFDDAFVAYDGVNFVLNATQFKAAVVQTGGSRGFNATLWIAPMLPNTAVPQGLNAGWDPDGAEDTSLYFPDLGAAVPIDTVTVTPNGSANAVGTVLTFTPGGALYAAGYVSGANPTKLGFFIGMSFDITAAPNEFGWVTADSDVNTAPPGTFPAVDIGYNLDVSWDYLNPLSNDEFAAFANPDLAGLVPTTFNLQIEGALVPEPGVASLFFGSSLLLLKRRRIA